MLLLPSAVLPEGENWIYVVATIKRRPLPIYACSFTESFFQISLPLPIEPLPPRKSFSSLPERAFASFASAGSHWYSELCAADLDAYCRVRDR
jgi:hypothetical protein